jgi:hypothetical protein
MIRVLVQFLGTVQGETFSGMPSVQSVIGSFAFPELTLYKAQSSKRLHALFDRSV